MGRRFFSTLMVQLLFIGAAPNAKYCEKRALQGVAKTQEVTQYRVPWRGRHSEKFGDVIIYPVLVAYQCLRGEQTQDVCFDWLIV